MNKAFYLLHEKGLTQAQVAKDYSLNRVNLCRMLNGNQKPTAKYLNALKLALEWNDDPDELFEEIEVKL